MNEEKLRVPLTERFTNALSMAALLHRDQSRKGTQIPYVAHLLAVAGIALEYGATEDEAIAALLHDAVEDQGGEETAALICEQFGSIVSDIVLGCTDATVIPKPPWRARKEAYIAHVAESSRSVRLVSTSDKLHNARALLADYRVLGDALWSRFNGGKDGTLWYYRSLTKAFREAGTCGPLAELERTVSELERLAG